MSARALFVCVSLSFCAPAFAQPAPAAAAADRITIQTLTLSSRYRRIEDSAGTVTANQVQFKDTLRLRVNLDTRGRVALSASLLSGNSFTGSWDNTGLGSGAPAGTQSLRQLFVSVAPAAGVELQAGGLAIARGESTEITSYDDDGYLMGGRVVVRRPARIWFDEVSASRAALGPSVNPGVLRHLDTLAHPDYWQAQLVKRIGSAVRASADFTSVGGADTARAGVLVRLPKRSPVSSLRVEQYRRVSPKPAGGFALAGERAFAHLRLQGGYATIDRDYGGLNADRLQRGRRLFGVATVPLVKALSAQLFATRALADDYPIANRTRVDVVVTYDVLASLRPR